MDVPSEVYAPSRLRAVTKLRERIKVAGGSLLQYPPMRRVILFLFSTPKKRGGFSPSFYYTAKFKKKKSFFIWNREVESELDGGAD